MISSVSNFRPINDLFLMFFPVQTHNQGAYISTHHRGQCQANPPTQICGQRRTARWWGWWDDDDNDVDAAAAAALQVATNLPANTDTLHKRTHSLRTDHTTTLLFKLQSDTFVPADREFAFGFSSLHTECRWVPGWLG